MNQNYAPKAGCGKRQVIAPTTKPESNSHDHVIAERKRREKLSQQFIALSGMVPGIIKVLFLEALMQRASVIFKHVVLDNNEPYANLFQCRLTKLLFSVIPSST